jgi:tetratricopeptide (TPR) repeat protein
LQNGVATEGFYGARESAEKAIALNPNLATGYLAMAMIQMNHDWDWVGAEVSLKRAALLEPGSSAVLSDRAYLSRMLGRADEAIELYKQAIALDPLRADSHLAMGYVLYLVGRNGEAQAVLQKRRLNPSLAGE